MMRAPRIRIGIFCLGVSILSGLTPACTSRPPQISRSFHQLNYFYDRALNRVVQKLSIHMIPEDPDGLEDLAAMYLIHDEAELFWELDKDSWLNREAQGSVWVGSNGFTMPDGSNFPPGEYRVLIVDLSGESAEESFFLDDPGIDAASLSFPRAAVEGDLIEIASSYQSNELWVYDPQFRLSIPVGPRGLTVRSLRSRIPDLAETFFFYVYAFDGAKQIGVVSGPYYP
jgi:hypothetical protein